jgi:hypothetical protein
MVAEDRGFEEKCDLSRQSDEGLRLRIGKLISVPKLWLGGETVVPI